MRGAQEREIGEQERLNLEERLIDRQKNGQMDRIPGKGGPRVGP